MIAAAWEDLGEISLSTITYVSAQMHDIVQLCDKKENIHRSKPEE